jgi:peptide/nickel transport system substrate-binding protein
MSVKRTLILVVAAALLAVASAQVEVSKATPAYAATAKQGGTVNETLFGDITTLNPVLASSANEAAIIGMYAGPGAIYRDWVGNRSFQKPDGSYNLSWAKNVQVLKKDQQFIVTVRKGWKWSDGVEMTTADVKATWDIVGDPKVESNNYSCSVVGNKKVQLKILGKYQYEITLPEPQVNALAVNDCVTVNGLIPAHIFMPVYKAKGAAGIKALWGVDSDVSKIVSGGPYKLQEFRAGERVVLVKNPQYGKQEQAADGSPLPGPDRWVVTMVKDENQVLSRAITGQSDFYWPVNLDQVKAVKDAIDKGQIKGDFYANIGPSSAVDFITYNFNNTDKCKADMFRNVYFRRAISDMIDRKALVNAALGGLGYPAKDWNTEAAKPFNAPNLKPFVFDPEAGVQLLHNIGFTQKDKDGVLTNPTTGCKVAFDLQYNSGNTRRGQEAQVIAQTVAPYGVKINPREVSTQIWANSIVGTSADFNPAKGRKVNYDAQIWGLAGGDVDNPSFDNGLRPGTNLNAWNKSKTDLQPWETLMGQYTVDMNAALDLQKRVQIYDERAALMREWLPLTPLISQAFSFYTDLGNTWPKAALDANSIQSPYNPGNFRDLLTVR